MCDDLYDALDSQEEELAKINYEIVKLNREMVAHLQVPEPVPQSLLDEVTALHEDRDAVDYVISEIEDAINTQGC
jgi:hypothetical protein